MGVEMVRIPMQPEVLVEDGGEDVLVGLQVPVVLGMLVVLDYQIPQLPQGMHQCRIRQT
jgi:hypothetical protein